MEENSTRQNPQEMVEQVYELTANLLFKQKKTTVETKQILIQQGLTAEAADAIISNLQQQRKQAKNKAARKNMLHGILWCVGGLLVTLLTYNMAEEGGRYVVAWGAVIFGAYQFFKGFMQWVNE